MKNKLLFFSLKIKSILLLFNKGKNAKIIDGDDFNAQTRND